MNRRTFIKQTTAAAAAITFLPDFATTGASSSPPSGSKLPRWRGFNLLEKFSARKEGNPSFVELDFALMQEWGFDFARLPMSYHCWADPADWLNLREKELKHIDEAVEFGRKYQVHINLNLHRAPGYCVNPPKEPLDLWTDEKALEACAFHWAHFAKRYKGIPNERVSFDLLNEPPRISEEIYVRVVKRLVEAIRTEDPQRLIVADGISYGREPVHSLVPLGLAQSTRGYDPFPLTHYKANWVNSQNWAEPSWPFKGGKDQPANKEQLRTMRIQPWKELADKGVGVHVGEWGVFNKTPHSVTLAWMQDVLSLWQEAGWGWALWNLRGPFGVLNSNRDDVQYESFRNHQLDRKMLEILRRY